MEIKSRYRFDICDLTCDEFIVIHDAIERYAKEVKVSDTSVIQHLLDVLDKRRMAGMPHEISKEDFLNEKLR